MVTNVIEVKDVIKRYDGRDPVLNGITFSIEERELAVVYGNSGCGKTTLLNILGGLDHPTSGDVRIDGVSIVGMNEEQLAALRLSRLGFVFQDYNLLPELTVRQNIGLPLQISKARSSGQVAQLLGKFDLEQIADQPSNRISGGEAQRTAIARAIVNHPRIILADEPTGSLDRENSERVMSALELARREYGAAVVLATHDTDLVARSTKGMHLVNGLIAP